MRISDWSSDVCSSDLADRSQPHLLDIVHVDAGFDQHAGDELAIDAARAKEVLAGAAQRDVVGEIIAELVEEGDRPRSIGRGVDVELQLAKGEQWKIGRAHV